MDGVVGNPPLGNLLGDYLSRSDLLELVHLLRQLENGCHWADLRGDRLDIAEHGYEGDHCSEDRDEDEQDTSPLTRIHQDSLTGWGTEARGACAGTLGHVPHRRHPCGTAI